MDGGLQLILPGSAELLIGGAGYMLVVVLLAWLVKHDLDRRGQAGRIVAVVTILVPLVGLLLWLALRLAAPRRRREDQS